MVGVVEAASWRSGSEKDRHVAKFRRGGDTDEDGDDSSTGCDFLLCGGNGGRRILGDDEFRLVLLSELVVLSARAIVLLLDLACLFGNPPRVLSKKMV